MIYYYCNIAFVVLYFSYSMDYNNIYIYNNLKDSIKFGYLQNVVSIIFDYSMYSHILITEIYKSVCLIA